jgi:hypothetical protein
MFRNTWCPFANTELSNVPGTWTCNSMVRRSRPGPFSAGSLDYVQIFPAKQASAELSQHVQGGPIFICQYRRLVAFASNRISQRGPGGAVQFSFLDLDEHSCLVEAVDQR